MSVPHEFTQTDIIKARDFLRERVHTKSKIVGRALTGNPFVSYGEVARHMGYEIESEWDGDRIGDLVGAVSHMEHACGNPLISALVVIAATQTPGKGLYNLGRELLFLKQDADLIAELTFWKDQTFESVRRWGGHNTL
jgi:hypothetical protein